MSCSPPSACSLPVVSGRPRLAAHRRFEKNAALIWATMARRFPSLLADATLCEEAWSAGALGLFGACERFDPKKGFTFATYAVSCIDGELRRFVLSRNTGIKQPMWLAELTARVRRCEQTFQTQTGRAPTDEETALSLGIRVSDVARVRASQDVFNLHSLDALASAQGEDGRPLQDTIPDRRQEAPGAQILAEAGTQALLELLTPQQRRVMEGLYVLEMNAQEMAPTLGISSTQVRQLHQGALCRLRKKAGLWRNERERNEREATGRKRAA